MQLLFWIWVAKAQETCFPDAIREGARKNLTNAEGESYPLGFGFPPGQQPN